jgi:iron complex transport system substrate-binding protein
LNHYQFNYPSKIICLTEESVETLFLIGKGHLIKGVSSFVKRPKEALDLPKVSFFTSSNLQKIVNFSPDLVLGFSDIQKDIAKDLIGAGLNVWISNHRSVQELLNYIVTLSSMVGAKEDGEKLVKELIDKINSIKNLATKFSRKPRVYFEEWDEPKISAIRWVSEFIEIAGGEDIFKDKSQGAMAKERFVSDQEVINANPDIVLGCWCGKKFNKNAFVTREGYQNINAVKNNQVFEVEPEIFLQPGPAPILDGLDILYTIFTNWSQSYS